MTGKRAEYYGEINISRGIITLLVVLGHAFPDAQTGITRAGCAWVVNFLYSFHMACFFVLSGFVMGGKLCQEETCRGREIYRKMQRLLVPYLFHSCVAMIMKQFLGDYANRQFKMGDFWRILVGESPNGGMWYLWTLFLIQLIFIVCSKWIRKGSLLLGLGVLGYVLAISLPVGPYTQVLFYSVFFSVGILIREYYCIVVKLYFKVYLSVSIFAFLTIIAYPLDFPYWVTGICGTYVVLTSGFYLWNSKGYIKKFLGEIGTYSYDIYLISYYLMVCVRILCYRVFRLNYAFVVGAMFFVGIVFSYWIAKYLLRRIKIARMIFLGDFSKEKQI